MVVTPSASWLLMGSDVIQLQKEEGVIALQVSRLQRNLTHWLEILRLAAANFSSKVRLERPGRSVKLAVKASTIAEIGRAHV